MTRSTYKPSTLAARKAAPTWTWRLLACHLPRTTRPLLVALDKLALAIEFNYVPADFELDTFELDAVAFISGCADRREIQNAILDCFEAIHATRTAREGDRKDHVALARRAHDAISFVVWPGSETLAARDWRDLVALIASLAQGLADRADIDAHRGNFWHLRPRG